MIKEDYVSAKIARLLEKKGFDETCYACYEYFESGVTLYKGWMFEYKGIPVHNSSERIKCPTQQMVMKWLREVHKIFIEIGVSIDLNGKYHYGFRLLNSTCKNILEPKDLVKMGFKDTYEEACEASIKYTLENLIQL